MDFIKIIKVGIKPAGAVAVPQVAVGRYNTVALKADGTVWTWGNNATGQLGNGTKDNSVTPIQVMNGGKPLGNIIMISTGGANRSGIRAHVLALSNDGTIWSWGDNVFRVYQTDNLYSALERQAKIDKEVMEIVYHKQKRKSERKK